MKIIFIVLMSLISKMTIAQTNYVYSSIDTNSSTILGIYFYNDGCFEIIMQKNISSDIISVYLLSYGNYTINQNKIVCTDLYNDFNMQFDYMGDTIVPLICFDGFLKKNFIRESRYVYNQPFFQKIHIQSIEQSRLTHNKCYKYENTLYNGVFADSEGFKLEIQKNNMYKFSFDGFLLLKGIWKRKENELVLYNSTLNHSFYILVGETVLISKILPGAYNSYLLIRNK